jgi:hypothetical protein
VLTRLALAALLAACTAPQRVAVPVADRRCPEAPEAPPSLPRIVSPEGLRILYWRERSARLETMGALAECSERLAAVLQILKGTDP